jgi:predicted dehydrogenase
MRANPLWRAAADLRASGVLGRLLHMDLANHAAGLNLPHGHWFWDKAISGGIWIEHGVHFFDAFAWVAGTTGRVTAAQAFTHAQGCEDRVQALAVYGDAAAHVYHGFTHSSATERTTVRLTFEHGYLTLHEWVPTVLEIAGIDAAQAEAVRPLLPGVVQAEAAEGPAWQARAVLPEGKAAVYRACVQQGMRQLAQAVRDPAAPLAVTAEHGLASLRMAVAAEALAQA